MKTVLMNIRDEFQNLCVMVPIDDSLQKHEDVPIDQKKWIWLGLPWLPSLPDEDLIPKPPGQPPGKLVNRFKAIMSQWFFKDTLATPYSRVE